MSEDKKKVADILITELQQQEYEFTDANGIPLEINNKGSIGLLAIGYKGLVALRNTRARNNFKIGNELIAVPKKEKE